MINTRITSPDIFPHKVTYTYVMYVFEYFIIFFPIDRLKKKKGCISVLQSTEIY